MDRPDQSLISVDTNGTLHTSWGHIGLLTCTIGISWGQFESHFWAKFPYFLIFRGAVGRFWSYFAPGIHTLWPISQNRPWILFVLALRVPHACFGVPSCNFSTKNCLTRHKDGGRGKLAFFGINLTQSGNHLGHNYHSKTVPMCPKISSYIGKGLYLKKRRYFLKLTKGPYPSGLSDLYSSQSALSHTTN